MNVKQLCIRRRSIQMSYVWFRMFLIHIPLWYDVRVASNDKLWWNLSNRHFRLHQHVRISIECNIWARAHPAHFHLWLQLYLFHQHQTAQRMPFAIASEVPASALECREPEKREIIVSIIIHFIDSLIRVKPVDQRIFVILCWGVFLSIQIVEMKQLHIWLIQQRFCFYSVQKILKKVKISEIQNRFND